MHVMCCIGLREPLPCQGMPLQGIPYRTVLRTHHMLRAHVPSPTGVRCRFGAAGSGPHACDAGW